jgi:hypothetical protein
MKEGDFNPEVAPKEEKREVRRKKYADITWKNPVNIDIYQFLTACGYYKQTRDGIITPGGKYNFVDLPGEDFILVMGPDGKEAGRSKATDSDGTTIRTNRLIEIVMEHERFKGLEAELSKALSEEAPKEEKPDMDDTIEDPLPDKPDGMTEEEFVAGNIYSLIACETIAQTFSQREPKLTDKESDLLKLYAKRARLAAKVYAEEGKADGR